MKQLIVNGCSYMHSYASGNGHVDLARRLGIDISHSIAVSGSANSRIIRTTLKHSYQTTVPALYVLGMTFLSRLEIPILDKDHEFEGHWVNPQNQQYQHAWQPGWTKAHLEKWIDLKLRWEFNSVLDRTEDLMYQLLSLIESLHSRGHRVLIFQQADSLYQEFLHDPRLKLFDKPEFIDGYKWRAVPWQHQQGILPTLYFPPQPDVPRELVHPKPGSHDILNAFLTNYINEYKILA